jgi:hypothetical protein
MSWYAARPSLLMFANNKSKALRNAKFVDIGGEPYIVFTQRIPMSGEVFVSTVFRELPRHP